MQSEKKPKVIISHYLMCSRLDNWLRLLWSNRRALDPKRIPQMLLITLMSLLLFPFALLEALLFAIPIKRTKLKKDPIFIIGHWRSGTTYLQNLLSRDAQFAWADPVSTVSLSNSILLRPLLRAGQKGALVDARPMDNMRYSIQLPMEETFALATISQLSIIHAVAFPYNFEQYLPSVFVEDMDKKHAREWRHKYSYILKKLTFIHRGRQLILKSPDNTGHLRELLELYPNACFVNIHRDPYVTLMSTVNMFKKQMDRLRLTRMPDFDLDEKLEDVFIGIFERMYRELFQLERQLPPGRIVSVDYSQVVINPAESLKLIYDTLGLSGYEQALPRFKEYIESQAGYVKNRFQLTPRLRDKINDKLGFYFEHYGYKTEDAQ